MGVWTLSSAGASAARGRDGGRLPARLSASATAEVGDCWGEPDGEGSRPRALFRSAEGLGFCVYEADVPRSCSRSDVDGVPAGEEEPVLRAAGRDGGVATVPCVAPRAADVGWRDLVRPAVFEAADGSPPIAGPAVLAGEAARRELISSRTSVGHRQGVGDGLTFRRCLADSRGQSWTRLESGGFSDRGHMTFQAPSSHEPSKNLVADTYSTHLMIPLRDTYRLHFEPTNTRWLAGRKRNHDVRLTRK